MNNNNSKNHYTEAEKNEYKQKRREIREQCFIVLFEMTFTDDSYQDILDNAVESRTIVADEYMLSILDYYSQNKEKIDSLISSNLKNGWTIERLSRAALSILRLAISEMNSSKIAGEIVINEAVEIAKKYTTPKDASFINGVLGSIVRNKNKS